MVDPTRVLAGEHGHVIVSKDSDFRRLAFLHGPPPKAIGLRVGNASTSTVLQVLLDHYRPSRPSKPATTTRCRCCRSRDRPDRRSSDDPNDA